MSYESRNDSSFSLFTSIFSSLLLWMQLFLGIRWNSFYKDTRRTWNNWSSTLAPHALYQCLSESHNSHMTFWFYFRICIGGHEVSTFICTYTHLYNTLHVYHFSLSLPPSLLPFNLLSFKVRPFPCSQRRPYACGGKCGRVLPCGNHFCEIPCHLVINPPSSNEVY